MKPIHRLTWRIILALSLLLSLAVAIVGIRSLWVIDRFTLAAPIAKTAGGFSSSGWYVFSSGGTLRVGHEHATWPGPKAAMGYTYDQPRGYSHESLSTGFTIEGLWFWHDHYIDAQTYVPALPWNPAYVNETRFVRIPWWMIFVVTLAPVWMMYAIRPISARKEKKLRLGLCLRCGYDLRGSSDRCPECGTIKMIAKALG